jgi:hypothetical protein
MAKWQLWNEKGEGEWTKHVAKHSHAAQKTARVIRHDTLYRLKTTGERVVPLSYMDDGSVCVRIESRFNPEVKVSDHEVKVTDLTMLEECELPEGMQAFVLDTDVQ